jgi:hypothetical protein
MKRRRSSVGSALYSGSRKPSMPNLNAAPSRKSSIGKRMSVVQQQVVSLREADGDATDIALLRFSTQYLEEIRDGFVLNSYFIRTK